jgi:2-hydroxychromene-2-carboxylate isomerase
MSQPIEATASLAPVEFYFDFTSPYGYLASEKIDALAARYDRRVKWRPFLMGVALKATGAGILTQIPLKGEYSLHDFARSARFLDIPYEQPANFPLSTQHAARAHYWLHDRDCQAARSFAHAVFRALYTEGRDISDSEVVLEIAAGQQVDRAALAAALNAATEGSPEGRVRGGYRHAASLVRHTSSLMANRSLAPIACRNRALAGQRRFLMPVLSTRLDVRSADFKASVAAMGQDRRRPAGDGRSDRARRSRGCPAEASGARQAAAARAGRCADRPRFALPRIVAARCLRHVR